MAFESPSFPRFCVGTMYYQPIGSYQVKQVLLAIERLEIKP